jgi:cephalosporin-C deacetylase-like acetyl esterase
LFLMILTPSAAPLHAQDDADTRLLRWLDRIAQQQLDQRAAEIQAIRTVEAAERRKQHVREKILEIIGGLPDYSGPFNAKVTGRIERPDFVIEKVVFESLPQFYVTANLYLPKTPGRHPGVLIALGHWDEGKAAEQQLAMNLAMKGFVVLAWDPIGQGERVQAYDARTRKSLGAWSVEQHFQAGGQSLLAGESFARYRIWDGMRALDYLVSRPEVDPERIGCTGCSGGGTDTTYLSALDDRIKAAAPGCYLTSFRMLFAGRIGDSEMSLPYFLSSGLELTDFVELFAPKPWLIVSTIGDFFPLEGARQIYEEGRSWYRLYGAEEHIGWTVGPGEHGTPQPVREDIYRWMIRWLNDGKGDGREQSVETLPAHDLWATPRGQVSLDLAGREVYQIIRDRFEDRRAKSARDSKELLAEVAKLTKPLQKTPLQARVTKQSRDVEWTSEEVVLETEPGIEVPGTLLVPRTEGRKPALLVIDSNSAPMPLALEAARKGAVVFVLAPRGMPYKSDNRPFAGDWAMNTRAWLVGRNLSGMRAFDIRRGVEWLAARPEVDAGSIRAFARAEAGVWLLLAAAGDERIQRVWLDKTPYSLCATLDRPLNRNLHAAILPGFCLAWDLADLAKAIGTRSLLWTDPTDWLGNIVPLEGEFRYRGFGEGDGRFLEELLK